MTILGIIALIGAAVSAFFFRKGGIYNPIEDTPSTDRLTEIKLETPDSIETVVAVDYPFITETTPTEPNTASTATLENLCKAIALMEGANPANNNEGNCRYHEGGYAPVYGVVRRSPGGFAMFATPQLGHLYLRNMIKSIIKNHPNLTLFTFFAGERNEAGRVIPGGYSGYAPALDNNDPKHYSSFVAGRLEVTPAFLMKRLILT